MSAYKLSDAECRSIAVARYRGTRPADLAIRYGVSIPTIYGAIKRSAITSRAGLGTWPPDRPRPVRRHAIEDIRYALEWILCSCGVEIIAEPDELFHERHEPLVTAWTEHRRDVGARILSVAQEASFHRAFS